MGVHHATGGGSYDYFVKSNNTTTSTKNTSGTTSSSASTTASELTQLGTQMATTIGQMLSGNKSAGAEKAGKGASGAKPGGNGNPVPSNTKQTPGNVNQTPGNGNQVSGDGKPVDNNGNPDGAGNTNTEGQLTPQMRKVSIFSTYDNNQNSTLEYADQDTASKFEGKQLSASTLTSSNSQLQQLSSNFQSSITDSITQKLSTMWQNSITTWSGDYQKQDIEVEYNNDTITEKGQQAQEQAQTSMNTSTLTQIQNAISQINQQIQTDIQQAIQDAVAEAKQQQIDSGSIELNGQTYTKVEGEENKFTCNGQTYIYDGQNMTPEAPKADDAGSGPKLSNDQTKYTSEDASTVITRAIKNNAYNSMSAEDRQRVDDLVYDYMDSHESVTLAEVQQHLIDNGIDPKSINNTQSKTKAQLKADGDAAYAKALESGGSTISVRGSFSSGSLDNLQAKGGFGSGKASSMNDFMLNAELEDRRTEMQNRSHRGELRPNERELHTQDGGMGIEADLGNFKPDSKYDNPYTASLLNYKGIDGVSYMNTVIKGKNGDVLVECKGGQLLDAQGNKIKQQQAEEILKNAHETGQLSKLQTYT